MANYFPRQTIVWKGQDTPAFRRIALSLPEMAVLTGVVLHCARALVAPRLGGSFLLFGFAYVAALVFLCGMATLHLGNYPIRHWLWRAPAFAALEGVVEGLVALPLIALAREPLGSTRAEWADWPSLAAFTLLWRVGLVLAYTATLAGVVQLVRHWLLRRDRHAPPVPPRDQRR